MGSFEIFTDSAANLPDTYRRERDIHVIPFRYIVDGKEYSCLEENVPFRDSAIKFYSFLRAGADIKTSLVSEADFIEAVTPALQAGKDALILTLASGISGTFSQARAAAKTLCERFSGRTVVAVDSANASLGQGLLALKAADLRDMGESVTATAEWLRDNVYRMNSYLTVDDLKYLRKSGRISTVLAIAGNLLSIKPIIRADGGQEPKLAVCGKEHGRKKAISAILRCFKENVVNPEEQVVAITHADCKDDALALAEEVKRLGAKDVIVEYYDICTGSHAGPGTLALFFVGKDRREKSAEQERASAKHRVRDGAN